MPERKYEYQAHSVMIEPGIERHGSAMLRYEDVEWWLNQMDEQGWEYVGQVTKHWHDQDIPQIFPIFRRPWQT